MPNGPHDSDNGDIDHHLLKVRPGEGDVGPVLKVTEDDSLQRKHMVRLERAIRRAHEQLAELSELVKRGPGQ